ncbi:hypothetical protein DV738_g4769, partial [Chaetothyriales sp. CBS 135597]
MNGPTEGAPESADTTTPFPDIDDEPRRADSSNTPSKRLISGNLLSKLTLLRTASSDPDNNKPDGGPNSAGAGAMAEAVQTRQKTRKRKGSLRKTVLGKGRDRKSSDVKNTKASSPLASPLASSVAALQSLSRVSIPSIRSSIASVDPASSSASIATGPRPEPLDASTEDEDDLMLRPSSSSSLQQHHHPHHPSAIRKVSSNTSSNTDSYFPFQEPVLRILTRPLSTTRSPLATSLQSIPNSPSASSVAAVPSSAAAAAAVAEIDDEWDYSETACWGYVILITTWVVFVVGMGSCFGVWTWAWDVGETPYAPPELEDDPTLPIVGYYPALMVLTCVMAWVWVVVAWVGMKYFRHASTGSASSS